MCIRDRFDFLRDIPDTFMLVSPLPQDTLDTYGLVQAKLPENEIGLFEDLMITPRDRHHTNFVQRFMHQIVEIEREIMEE